MTKIEMLLENILDATQRFEKEVTCMDSEPDMWLGILAEREEYIGCLIEQGFNSLSIQKEYQNQLLQINEINQRLIPLIDQRKQGVQKQLNNVRRSKMATNSYQEAGPNGYGAFFDRKK